MTQQSTMITTVMANSVTEDVGQIIDHCRPCTSSSSSSSSSSEESYLLRRQEKQCVIDRHLR